VNSRRSDVYSASYYWSADVVPGNVDEHIKYAKMAGFRAFMLYYPSFLEGTGYRKLGDYEWRRSEFPNGRDDLAKMLQKIKDAGMIPHETEVISLAGTETGADSAIVILPAHSNHFFETQVREIICMPRAKK
jgi:hypothetical protein